MTESERTRALQGRRAGFVSRIAAGTIDIALLFTLYFLVLVGIGAVGYLTSDEKFEVADPPGWLTGTTMMALIVFAFATAWSGSGRTLGDSAVGLRVVRETGARLSFPRAVARAVVLVIVPFVSMLWILVSKKNAGLHDLVCGTAVIYDWRPRRERVPRDRVPVPVPGESRQNSRISP